MDIDVIVGIVLTAVGVLILITTITTLSYVMRLLGKRAYSNRRWIFVQVMLVFFVIGYIINAIEMSGLYDIIPLANDLLMVSAVYFFGAIFTLVTIIAIRNMLGDMLGKQIPDNEAIEIFLKVTLPENVLTHLNDTFVIKCDECERVLTYTVPDVVRDHGFTLERGIQVEEVFGTVSYKLRPVHKCNDGRRGICVVHDDTLAVRNIEESRLIYGGRI